MASSVCKWCYKSQRLCKACALIRQVLCHPDNRIWLKLYGLTFLLILPLSCHNLQHSLFFLKPSNTTAARQQYITLNNQRIRQSHRYFKTQAEIKSQQALLHVLEPTSSASVDIQITIISVSRNRHKLDEYEPRYLTQVTWKFLTYLRIALAENYPYNVKIAICNVDPDPDSYDEALQLSRFVPVFQRFNHSRTVTDHVLEKEKQDYVYCLNSSLKSRPRYVLLVEDDALPYRDFFLVLRDVVGNRLDARYLSGDLQPPSQNVAFVKLYHPEKLVKFVALDAERIPELFGIGAVFGTLLTLCYHALMRRRNQNLLRIWAALFLYVVLVALCIGRANILEIRRLFSPRFYSFTPTPSCCTPALLFPQTGAHRVARYLDGVQCGRKFGKDSALDRMLKETHMRGYLIQPNLFTHIGLYSSLRKKVLDPFVV